MPCLGAHHTCGMPSKFNWREHITVHLGVEGKIVLTLNSGSLERHTQRQTNQTFSMRFDLTSGHLKGMFSVDCCILYTLSTCTVHEITKSDLVQVYWKYEQGNQQSREMPTWFWWQALMWTKHLQAVGIDGMITLRERRCTFNVRLLRFRVNVKTQQCILYSSTLSNKRYDFLEKKKLNVKYIFIFSTTFVWNIFHFKGNSTRYNKYTYVFV